MQNDKQGQVTSGEKGYAEFLICTALFRKLVNQTQIYFCSLAVQRSAKVDAPGCVNAAGKLRQR